MGKKCCSISLFIFGLLIAAGGTLLLLLTFKQFGEDIEADKYDDLSAAKKTELAELLGQTCAPTDDDCDWGTIKGNLKDWNKYWKAIEFADDKLKIRLYAAVGLLCWGCVQMVVAVLVGLCGCCQSCAKSRKDKDTKKTKTNHTRCSSSDEEVRDPNQGSVFRQQVYC